MSKKLISGALATMMAVSALSTGMVFADEVAPTDQMDNRPTAEEKVEMRENAEAHIQGIIDEYYPEIKDEWTQTAASIESLNTEIRDYMKAKIEGRKDSLQEMREAREEKVKMAKEERDEKVKPEKEERVPMTEEEKAALTEEEKMAMKDERDAMKEERTEKAADRDAKQAERTEKKEERDTKQAEQAAKVEEKQAQVEERKEDRSQAVAEKKEQRSATKESLVEAVEAGDTEAVKEILDSMLAAMQNHLTLMTERFDQMMAKDTASEPMDEPETEPVTE